MTAGRRDPVTRGRRLASCQVRAGTAPRTGLRRGGPEVVSGGVESGGLALGGPAVCRLRGFGSAGFSERCTFAGSPTGNLRSGGAYGPAGGIDLSGACQQFAHGGGR